MKQVLITFFLGIVFINSTISQDLELEVKRIKIGETTKPENAKVKLTLNTKLQHYNASPSSKNNIYDKTIHSPKSVQILNEKNKFYINSLEGFSTSVYDLSTFKLQKVIYHHFNSENSYLFHDTTLFDYNFRTISSNFNLFKGKPVEACFSHNGKYLWVTYYRRSYDKNAIDPSAVAIIDTDKDEIVRVMPTAPLPKMIACSPDNNFIAVTHWGDNTIGLIDISENDPSTFKYTNLFVVGKKMNLTYKDDEKVDRDKNCGNCLRGTVFTPDSKHLLVGRMGGGGIAVFDIEKRSYLKTVWGMQNNIRHLEINNNELFIGTNVTGYVQKTSLDSLIHFVLDSENSSYNNWKSKYVGKGVRTIVTSPDGKYIFAAINNESQLAVIQSSNMQVISRIDSDSFPVGMDIDNKGEILIVTTQGKAKYGGGHSVMIFNIEYFDSPQN